MLNSLIERLRDSLFLVPALLIFSLGAAAWLARQVDALVSGEPWLLPTTVDSTRSILSTVATATITVAGIVFSITAVVVQLATSQLSARVTQGLLRDRYQQVTIGFAVGTFVYALLILSDVQGTEEIPFSSHDFSVTAAVALGVMSMLLIVYYIDRTMRTLRIDTVIRRLSDETLEAVERLPVRVKNHTEGLPPPDGEPATIIEVPITGWVGGVDLHRFSTLLPPDGVARVDLWIGDFVTRGEVAAQVWGEVDDATRRRLAAAIDIDRTRSIGSDAAYGIRQMVDVALRALSPMLNDPTTAADVVRHLSAPVSALLTRDLPGRVVAADDGGRIYLPRVAAYSDYVHAAYREIRIHCAGQPYTLRALLETLASLISVVENAGHESRATALREEVAETVATIEMGPLPDYDKANLLEFARRLALIQRR